MVEMGGIAPPSELVLEDNRPQAWFADLRQATRSTERKEANICLLVQAPLISRVFGADTL
jgi:hypothetical protein